MYDIYVYVHPLRFTEVPVCSYMYGIYIYICDMIGFSQLQIHLGGSKNGGTLKSSILIGFSLINHPLRGTPIYGNPHIGSLSAISRNQWVIRSTVGLVSTDGPIPNHFEVDDL